MLAQELRDSCQVIQAEEELYFNKEKGMKHIINLLTKELMNIESMIYSRIDVESYIEVTRKTLSEKIRRKKEKSEELRQGSVHLWKWILGVLQMVCSRFLQRGRDLPLRTPWNICKMSQTVGKYKKRY